MKMDKKPVFTILGLLSAMLMLLIFSGGLIYQNIALKEEKDVICDLFNNLRNVTNSQSDLIRTYMSDEYNLSIELDDIYELEC